MRELGPTAGIVYLFEADNHLFKPGKSFDPNVRVARFNTTPVAVRFVHKIETNDTKWLERVLHQRFRDKRIRGEWFALTDDDVAEIVKTGRLDRAPQDTLFDAEIGHRLAEARASGHERARAGPQGWARGRRYNAVRKGREKGPRVIAALPPSVSAE